MGDGKTGKIAAIHVKTGNRWNDGTDANLRTSVMDASSDKRCKTNVLDKHDHNDFWPGSLGRYEGWELGRCSGFEATKTSTWIQV